MRSPLHQNQSPREKESAKVEKESVKVEKESAKVEKDEGRIKSDRAAESPVTSAPVLTKDSSTNNVGAGATGVLEVKSNLTRGVSSHQALKSADSRVMLRAEAEKSFQVRTWRQGKIKNVLKTVRLGGRHNTETTHYFRR